MFTATSTGRTELVGGYRVSNDALKSLLNGDCLTDDIIFGFIKLPLLESFRNPFSASFCEVTRGLCIFIQCLTCYSFKGDIAETADTKCQQL